MSQRALRPGRHRGPWYFLALFFWRSASPILLQLRWPFIWAVGVSILGPFGVEREAPCCLRETFYFLPYFVFGLHTEPRVLLRLIRQREVQLASAVVLFVVLPLALLAYRAILIGSEVSHGGAGRTADGVYDWLLIAKVVPPMQQGGLFLHLALLGVRAVLAVMALSVLMTWEQQGRLVVQTGRRTTFSFLVHATLLMDVGEKLGASTFFSRSISAAMAIPLLFIGSVAMNVLCASQAAVAWFGWFCKPDWTSRWLWSDTPIMTQAAGAARAHREPHVAS